MNLNSIIKSQETKYFALFAIGGAIQFIFGYVLTFVSNYTLNSSQMGQFSYYFNLSNFIVNAVSLGLYASYIRIIGEGFDNALRKLVLCCYTVIAILYSIICFALELYFMIPFVFLLFFNERQYYYRSKENTKYYLLGQILRGVSLILIIFLLFIFEKISFKNLILAVGISYFCSSVVFFFNNSTVKREGDLEKFSLSFLNDIDFKKVLNISIPTYMTSIATWLLLFSDQYIIKLYYSFEDLGPYSVAVRLIVFLQIVSSLFLLYYPKFYFKSLKASDFSKIKLVRRAFYIVFFILVLFLITFRDYLYYVLGASKFVEFSYFFIYLVIAEMFRILASINLTYLSFIYKTKYTTYTIIFVSLVNILLNFLFIEKFGIIFAAYSTLLSCFVFFVISFIISIKKERFYMRSALEQQGTEPVL